MKRLPYKPGYVVDAVRTTLQIERLRERFPSRVAHIHLTAGPTVLEVRFRARARGAADETASRDEAMAHRIEGEADNLAEQANLVIDTSSLTLEQVINQIAPLCN